MKAVQYVFICVLLFSNEAIVGFYQRRRGVFHHSSLFTCDITSSDASFLSLVPFPHSQELVRSDVFDSVLRADDLSGSQFGSLFRQCAPYLAMHRSSTVVIHIPSTIFSNRDIFDGVMDDISILHLMGVQIILVAGVRDLLDEKIHADGTIDIVYHEGMRVTDEATLRMLKEVSGYARYEIESALARGFRGSGGPGGISVVSGNFFYSAKPLGVRSGVDFKFTGEVRKVEVDNFKKRLEAGDIVLLTALGYSNSGEVFNVPSESLAADCAARLQASKLIFFTNGQSIRDERSGAHVQSLRLAQAAALLDRWGIQTPAYNQVEGKVDGTNGNGIVNGNADRAELNAYREDSTAASGGTVANLGDPSLMRFLHMIARGVHALTGGVKRVHLIPTYQGSILKELYTRDGAGILIARDVYEGIRPALNTDVRAVEEIIRPLEEEGILVHRTRMQLEKDMQDCYVLTRDNATLACGMLKKYGDKHAEICCLAVHPSYRRAGRGETMLAYLERRAVLMNIDYAFVLSTRTMQWFEERGFVLSDPSALPESRVYNASRGSKVYIKKLGSQRDIDAEELLWNV